MLNKGVADRRIELLSDTGARYAIPSRTADICLGMVIRRRRVELKQTQEELGQKVDLSYQQIQKYETGLNRVAFPTLLALAIALGCSATDLVTDAEMELRRAYKDQ